MAVYVTDKIRQRRPSKALTAFSCIVVADSFTKEKFCLHVGDARWYHLLGPSSLLMIGSPCVA